MENFKKLCRNIWCNNYNFDNREFCEECRKKINEFFNLEEKRKWTQWRNKIKEKH